MKRGVPQTSFGSWKTWERGGPPDLAVEIISPNEGDGIPWQEKLGRYHELGVRELLRFDPEAEAGNRLRAWDRLREDLVERRVADDTTPCLTLGLVWVVRPADDEAVGLRLANEAGVLVETRLEAETRARRVEAQAHEKRVKELEEENPEAQGRGLVSRPAEVRPRILALAVLVIGTPPPSPPRKRGGARGGVFA